MAPFIIHLDSVFNISRVHHLCLQRCELWLALHDVISSVRCGVSIPFWAFVCLFTVWIITILTRGVVNRITPDVYVPDCSPGVINICPQVWANFSIHAMLMTFYRMVINYTYLLIITTALRMLLVTNPLINWFSTSFSVQRAHWPVQLSVKQAHRSRLTKTSSYFGFRT